MKIQLAVVLLLVQVIALHAQTTDKVAPTDNKLKSNVDLAVQRSAQKFMDDKRAVGLSIGIYKDGRTYTYNYGATKKGTDKLPTKHTLYEIASITKTFTGLLLAQAVTEKRVHLDGDVRKYLEGSYPNLEIAVHSSVADMLKYIEFQLDEGDEAIKLSHRVTYGSMDDAATGLYWSMDKAPNGDRDVWHSGGSFGSSSFCLIALDSDFGVILLSNEADPETQNRIGKLAAEIKQAIN